MALEEDGTIRIGSLTSFSRITKDPIIQKYINVLGEAVDMVGGPQIRNAADLDEDVGPPGENLGLRMLQTEADSVGDAGGLIECAQAP